MKKSIIRGISLILICAILLTLFPVGAIAHSEQEYIETTSTFKTEPMVAGGGEHTVALQNNGTVWTWGQNAFGQLGLGSPILRTATPVQVQNLSEVTAVAAGASHTVAVRNDGTVWTWGNNNTGQLGDGTTIERRTPVRVQNLGGIIAVAAGNQHTLALRNDGTVWAWGLNTSGQLGDGTTTNHHTPQQVQNLSTVTTIAAGGERSVALRNDTTVWDWGWNGFTPQSTPAPRQNLNNITAIATSANHTVALRNDRM